MDTGLSTAAGPPPSGSVKQRVTGPPIKEVTPTNGPELKRRDLRSTPPRSSPGAIHTYSLTSPCPGEGLGDTWENCPPNNWCNSCSKCKICESCSQPCAEAPPPALGSEASLSPAPLECPGADDPWGCPPENLCEHCQECKICETCNPPCPNAHIDHERNKKDREIKDKREAALQRMREYSASRRASASQREFEKNQKKEKRANESSQEREARLRKAREYKARMKRMNEDYITKDRIQKRTQRANEAPAEREVRLQNKRDDSASRRASKTTTTSAKVKEATRQRAADIRSKRSEEEVKQDNLAAKDRMRELRKRDGFDVRQRKRYLAQFRGDYHTENFCEVKKWRLQVARGEDAGPEPLDSNGKPKYCHRCDQDLKVPLAGIGRCDCFKCAKLLGKEEEWRKARGRSPKKTLKK